MRRRATPGVSPTGLRAGLRAALLLLAVSTLTLSGCVVFPAGPLRGHGPPPHAPAHGYRHMHPSGVELRFDAGLGVWVAVGHRDLFWYDDHFVRIRRDLWEVSVSLEGPWHLYSASSLPPGLRKKYAYGPPLKGKARIKRGAAKRAP